MAVAYLYSSHPPHQPFTSNHTHLSCCKPIGSTRNRDKVADYGRNLERRETMEPDDTHSTCLGEGGCPLLCTSLITSATPQTSGQALRFEQLCQEFFSDPSQWWGTRFKKKTLNYPQFKYKSTEALWIEGRLTPPWVGAKLTPMAQPQTRVSGGFKQHYAYEDSGEERNRDVIVLCQQGRLKEALDILDAMDQQGILAYTSTYVCLLQGCISIKALAEGKRVHAHMIRSGFEKEVFLGNNLVRMYAKCGSIIDALQVFKKLPERNSLSWNTMISGYAEIRHDEEALKLLRAMQQRDVKLDKFTSAKILKVCANLTALEEGKWVHAHIIKNRIELNVFVGSSLINMYAKCGSIEDARQVFNKLPKQDLVTWNAMISGYSQHGHSDEALELFQLMQQEGTKPDVVTWNAIIAGYAQHGRGEEAFRLFGQMQREGVKPNVVSWTSMIAGYAQHGQGDEALEFFWQMQQEGVKPSVVTWNAMIAGYVQHGRGEEALGFLRQMVREGVKPDVVSWTSMIAGYAQDGRTEEAFELFQQMQQEGVKPDVVSWNAVIAGFAQQGRHKEAFELFRQMRSKGVKPNVCSWNALIAGYAQHGCGEEALHLFQQMQREGIKPDVISWNTMIAGYAQHGCGEQALGLLRQMQQEGVKPNVVSWNGLIAGYIQHGRGEEALELFWQMQQEGVKPDNVTITSILSTCVSLGALEQGKQVHANIIITGLESDVSIGNALVDMYAKCGSIEDAFQVFEKMSNQDVVTWNVIIAGYALHGHGKRALQLFEKMQEDGLKPNHITFISVLSACSHVGLMDEGRDYFDSISRDHCITPTKEHYACMVNLLGHAGYLSDTIELISKMPVEPDAVVWRTLLGACKIHGNMELAEHVADCAIKLEPENSGPYVLLSNMYATVGRWKDQAKLRKALEDEGVIKQPGYSWIEVESRVHEFIVGDRLQPQMEEIYAELEGLAG